MTCSRLAYSTAGPTLCRQCRKPLHKCRCPAGPVSTGGGDGIVHVRRESKGRGGREVTVIEGLILPAAELKSLAKRLKTACGSGGTIKDQQVEIQGDRREVVTNLLREAGFTVRLSGG